MLLLLMWEKNFQCNLYRVVSFDVVFRDQVDTCEIVFIDHYKDVNDWRKSVSASNMLIIDS